MEISIACTIRNINHTDMRAKVKPPTVQEIEQRLNNIPGFNAMCFELFRQWTAEVKKELPDWEPDLDDEQEIVVEVRKAYIAAVQSSFSNDRDHQELLDMKEYYIVACGVTGFVQGTLGSNWSLRYLPKPDDYRKTLWMKAIMHYFMIYEEAAQEVNQLFTAYLQHGFLVRQDVGEPTPEDISYYKVMGDLQFEKNKPELFSFLMNTMTDYGFKFLTTHKEVDSPPVLDVFGAGNVAYLVVGEWVRAELGYRNYDYRDYEEEE